MSEHFQGQTLFRTHNAGELRKEQVGQKITLTGWVQRRRDLGGLIFIDLRDRSGYVQAVFEPTHSDAALMALGDKLRTEYVIAVQGTVAARDEKAINNKIATGEIEVKVEAVEILNAAKTSPFFIQDNIEVDENLRLKYRYLDLRRPEMQKIFITRSKTVKYFRDYLDDNGFLEVETPMLTKSTPEGARDYLVPSRVHPGEFYALPQSPQLFKQLLMVSGFERYYQVARCFRDEDLRADRQPEFTQLDIEQSFIPLDKFHEMIEAMMTGLFKKVMDVEIPSPFPRMTYAEAMARYGSDKPDIRFELELKDLSEQVRGCGFKVFNAAVEAGGQVKAIVAPGCASYSRKQIDELEAFAKRYGAKGLAWMALQEEAVKSPIAKFFSEEELQALITTVGATKGDLILFVADSKKVVADSLGSLRSKLGRELNLINESEFKFLWVTEFPLLEHDEESGRYVAAHHPFTMPMVEDLHLLETDPASVRAQAYDLALNGFEIGGGSMRIYNREVQERMFKALGFTLEEAWEQFGFLLEAFEYGTPPHGGIAFGLDRLIMIMEHRQSLRDTIAFPKTSSASDIMTAAPSPVTDFQLETLHIARQGKAIVETNDPVTK
ncbi:aspartate--tRNA ligase [Tumebacillus permanentifrigoris]|uniref:Aspartate--tRNA ligase n=1 Tax=Tumebacillus permanentifrigoris TaxID=378543 RepID=A0A316D6A2_9BACL|nr:aspartate--tRNA ligase [Tumebacillus permanentifrigoris]PWK09064.1 aspartyl-tRNA synthetase [Tumebacillus permanentifrigoris]